MRHAVLFPMIMTWNRAIDYAIKIVKGGELNE